MKKGKKESFFWTSYSDLMTSLFFIMLALFVLSVIYLQNQYKATRDTLKKIQNIENATKNLDTTYYQYNYQYKKHILKIKVNFAAAKSNVEDLDDMTKQKLIEAGKELSYFIDKTVNNYPGVQYVLVIEGQASKDSYKYNYGLSYARALSLKLFWEENSIEFLHNTEVLIAGSGTGGVPRDSTIETNNQRFIISIFPKPGLINNSIK
jgi:hypothetical protein